MYPTTARSLTCYILDDESATHVVLTKFISRFPFLQIVGQSLDPFEGLEQLTALQPDLLFLDVEMPDLSGVALLKTLPQPHPVVVMVTASPQYAADTYSFESVVHYLLKPVGYDKFVEAIHRATKRLGFDPNGTPNVPSTDTPGNPTVGRQGTEQAVASPSTTDPRETVPYFLLKEDKKLVRVAPDEIVFVEGMKDYMKLHLTNRVLIIHLTMGKLEAMLPPSQFLRVNRSYIVRRQAIKEIDGNLISTLDGKRVPIGVTYRDAVMGELEKNMVKP